MTEATTGTEDLDHPYDQAMRMWGSLNRSQMAQWLDPVMPVLPEDDFVSHETSFAAPVLRADQLISVGLRGQLLHVEYETAPNAGLVQRMYDYRGRIMRHFPGIRMTQHVIVLGGGQVRGYDDLQANGFAIDLKVIYLRDFDPSSFLTDPFLAPLAILARCPPDEREDLLTAALAVIHGSGHPKKAELLQITDLLAGIRLERRVVRRIFKESHMALDQRFVEYCRRETYWGQEVAAAAQQEGKEVGIELGREVGIELGREVGIELGIGLGREKMLLTQLLAKFGDSPQAERVAHRLAGWDDEAAVMAIMAADDLESLLDAQPPIQTP